MANDVIVQHIPGNSKFGRLPLHLATRLRDIQQRDNARIEKASPAIRSLLPIALALARIAASEDLACR
jgi:hypothetical protein